MKAFNPLRNDPDDTLASYEPIDVGVDECEYGIICGSTRKSDDTPCSNAPPVLEETVHEYGSSHTEGS